MFSNIGNIVRQAEAPWWGKAQTFSKNVRMGNTVKTVIRRSSLISDPVGKDKKRNKRGGRAKPSSKNRRKRASEKEAPGPIS